MDHPYSINSIVIELAREWIGTPYHHQASVKGVGCDCIGLIHGIYRELYNVPAIEVPAYSPDWGDHDKNESIIEAGNKFLKRINLKRAIPGDVVALRWKQGMVAKHTVVLVEDNRMIHSYNNSGVVEVNISDFWRNKFIMAYRFP